MMAKTQMQLAIVRAATDAEPVYQCEFCHHDANGELQWHWEDVNQAFYEQYDSERRGHRRVLYAAPPVPVSVPEWTNEQCLEFLSIAFRHAEIKGDLELDDIRLGVKMVNGSRAAMLQGAAGNSPVIPDGWVACVERMPSAGEQVLAYRPDAPESNDPLIKMATYVGGSAHGHGFDCYCKPTHWMPLPAAPQQED